MSFRVVTPGLSSLLVASPRAGLRHFGVAGGGPADRAAWRLANALVGNPPDTSALEVVLLGPTLIADADHDCALVGAPFTLVVEGVAIEPGWAFRVRRHQTLRIGGTPSGARAVLAVRGGFDSTPVEKTVLPVHPAGRLDRLSGLPSPTVSQLLGESAGELLAMPGPERDWFPGAGVYDGEFTALAQSDRMGVRLKGKPIPKRGGELQSGPVALGTVQVAHDGQPIVLGVEGQTIGGYPRVAQVVRASWDAIGQLRPGERVRFREVTVTEADACETERRSRLNTWLRRLALRQ